MTKKEKKVKTLCYTFITNLKLGGEIFTQGQRIKLDKTELKDFDKYVVLTKHYKGPQIIQKKGCGC